MKNDNIFLNRLKHNLAINILTILFGIAILFFCAYEIYHTYIRTYDNSLLALQTALAIMLVTIYSKAFANSFVESYIYLNGRIWKKISSLPFKLAKACIIDTTNIRVGILCPTCNDFETKIWERNIQQTHRNFKLYILDDSSDEKYKAEIDNFKAKHPGIVEVVRRTERKGYKVGNLNHFLHNYKTDCYAYAFFDADSTIRPDFLALNLKLLTYQGIDYVCSQVTAHNTNYNFSNCAKLRVDLATPYYLYQNALRNNPSYLGWAGIMKKSALEQIGGFDERSLNDDQVIQLSFAKHNINGIFSNLSPVSSQEPLTFKAFYTRESRWYNVNFNLLINEKEPVKEAINSSKENYFQKNLIFRNFYMNNLIYPVLFLIMAVLNTALYIKDATPTTFMNFKPLQLESAWIYLIGINFILKNTVQIVQFIRERANFKDAMKYVFIGARCDVNSLWRNLILLKGLGKSLFNIKHKNFNRTPKHATRHGKRQNLAFLLANLFILVAMLEASFVILNYFWKLFPIAILIMIYAMPVFWSVVLCLISFIPVRREQAYFWEALFKFNKLRKQYGFEQLRDIKYETWETKEHNTKHYMLPQLYYHPQMFYHAN